MTVAVDDPYAPPGDVAKPAPGGQRSPTRARAALASDQDRLLACGGTAARRKPPARAGIGPLAGRRWLALCGVLAVFISGCASSSGPLTRSGSGSASAPVTAAPSTAAPASATSSGQATQKITVTPAAGLSSGQTVLVAASGFSPNESLVVIECAVKGAATSSGDCDTAAMQGVTSDASGQVMVEFQVTKGPFGADKIVCGASQACLISVTQPTQSPTQEADERISFK